MSVFAKTKKEAQPSSASGNSTLPSGISSPNQNLTSEIAKGTLIEGIFKTADNVRIDGSIVGDVSCDKRIVMGKSGLIEGTVHTNDLIVRGKITGEIYVKGTLHLEKSAVIKGKIRSQFLIVDEGARYSGDCQIGMK